MKFDKEAIEERFYQVLRFLNGAMIYILTAPLYAYHMISYWVEEAISLNRELKDKLYLKRIHMTREEFDKFMDYKTGEREELKQTIESLEKQISLLKEKMTAAFDKAAVIQEAALEERERFKTELLDKKSMIQKLLIKDYKTCATLTHFLCTEFKDHPAVKPGRDCHETAIELIKSLHDDVEEVKCDLKSGRADLALQRCRAVSNMRK